MDWKSEAWKRIDALAEKLGVAGQYLWYVLVKQSYINGITNVVLALVCLVVVVYSYKIFKRNWAAYPAATYDEESRIITACVMSAIAFAVCGIAFTINLNNAVMNLGNPEYQAIKTVLQVVKGQ